MIGAVTVGISKSATEDRDYLVKFIDNDDGIFIVKSAGEAAWLVEGEGWMIFKGVMDVIPVW